MSDEHKVQPYDQCETLCRGEPCVRPHFEIIYSLMLTISVVTPSFNQGEFIEATIRSILSQEGDFLIDYIIMDGGSTDHTIEIIKKYETLLKEYCRLETINGHPYYVNPNHMNRDEAGTLSHRAQGIRYQWTSQKDNGQVDALKKGFRQAVGDILYWLNSDDILVDGNVFSKVCRYFTHDSNLQLLTADGPFISKEGNELGLHHVDAINFKELLFLDYHILQPSTFFRREVYNEDHLNEDYTCAFDADFFIRMLSNGINYKKTNDTFGAFRFYTENKTLGLNKQRYKEQNRIARTYSKNIYYIAISMFYRYMEIILKPRFNQKNPFFRSLFSIVKKAAYFLITGKPRR